MEIAELTEETLEGSQQALARLMTLIEQDSDESPEILKAIHPHLGKSQSIGITGPPGAGKSTLVDKLVSVMRNQGLTVGVIAVDPTSPFSGGAVLGDRVRMQQHYLDPGVFIRSMATRGDLGGVPAVTRNVMKLMDAFGKDVILVETVGVGQVELDIVGMVDTTIVVLVPESGDTIQTMKAGIMEIADVFVVNKADLPGADKLITELQSMIMLSCDHKVNWQPPVLAAQALNDVGIEEVYHEASKHYEFLQSSGTLLEQRKRQRKEELLGAVERRFKLRLSAFLKNRRVASLLEQVENAEVDPYSAVEIMKDESIKQGWLVK